MEIEIRSSGDINLFGLSKAMLAGEIQFLLFVLQFSVAEHAVNLFPGFNFKLINIHRVQVILINVLGMKFLKSLIEKIPQISNTFNLTKLVVEIDSTCR